LHLNGAHQLLASADDVNILEGSVHTINENTESLVAASKDIGLEVNTDKTKYIVVSGGQNAERRRNIKIKNICFERVEQFRYLGKTFTN
jgi:histidinol-phosphate/aromatic aminotransferase/cobyric acid decarboxylase-like protein